MKNAFSCKSHSRKSSLGGWASAPCVLSVFATTKQFPFSSIQKKHKQKSYSISHVSPVRYPFVYSEYYFNFDFSFTLLKTCCLIHRRSGGASCFSTQNRNLFCILLIIFAQKASQCQCIHFEKSHFVIRHHPSSGKCYRCHRCCCRRPVHRDDGKFNYFRERKSKRKNTNHLHLKFSSKQNFEWNTFPCASSVRSVWTQPQWLTHPRPHPLPSWLRFVIMCC